jgi:hypothetical protein
MPANINIDPNISLQLKQQDSMTGLSNLLNMANTAQQYKQLQQTNPLALEKMQMEIEQAKKLNPLSVRQSEETVKQSEMTTEDSAMKLAAKKYKAIADSQISMINNPEILAAEKDPTKADPVKLAELVTKNGMNQAKALGIPDDKAMELLKPYLDVANTNPSGLRQFFKERHIQGLDDASRTGALAASGVSVDTGAGGMQVQTGAFGPVPEGGVIKGTSYVKQVAPGSREQIIEDAEGKPVVVVMNADGVITGIRKLTNVPAAPTANTEQPVITQRNQQTQTQTPQTRVSPTMGNLLFPIRAQGDTAIDMTPQEKVAREQGDSYVSKLTNSQLDLSGQRRTLEDTIKAAEKIKNESWLKTEGIIGAAQRKVSTALGDTTYYELSKNLAGTALKAAESAGTTNARQDLIQASQGDVTYPPEVLIKVARRTYADLLNTDMQAKGAAAWKEKATSTNMDMFKRKWAENADSKAFEIMVLDNDSVGLKETNPKEYQKIKLQVDSLLGPNPAKREQLKKKIENLNKLSQNGEL